MKHGFMSCFFVICMDLGQLKLMKYCDMGCGEKKNPQIFIETHLKQNYICNAPTHIYIHQSKGRNVCYVEEKS